MTFTYPSDRVCRPLQYATDVNQMERGGGSTIAPIPGHDTPISPTLAQRISNAFQSSLPNRSFSWTRVRVGTLPSITNIGSGIVSGARSYVVEPIGRHTVEPVIKKIQSWPAAVINHYFPHAPINDEEMDRLIAEYTEATKGLAVKADPESIARFEQLKIEGDWPGHFDHYMDMLGLPEAKREILRRAWHNEGEKTFLRTLPSNLLSTLVALGALNMFAYQAPVRASVYLGLQAALAVLVPILNTIATSCVVPSQELAAFGVSNRDPKLKAGDIDDIATRIAAADEALSRKENAYQHHKNAEKRNESDVNAAFNELVDEWKAYANIDAEYIRSVYKDRIHLLGNEANGALKLGKVASLFLSGWLAYGLGDSRYSYANQVLSSLIHIAFSWAWAGPKDFAARQNQAFFATGMVTDFNQKNQEEIEKMLRAQFRTPWDAALNIVEGHFKYQKNIAEQAIGDLPSKAEREGLSTDEKEQLKEHREVLAQINANIDKKSIAEQAIDELVEKLEREGLSPNEKEQFEQFKTDLAQIAIDDNQKQIIERAIGKLTSAARQKVLSPSEQEKLERHERDFARITADIKKLGDKDKSRWKDISDENKQHLYHALQAARSTPALSDDADGSARAVPDRPAKRLLANAKKTIGYPKKVVADPKAAFSDAKSTMADYAKWLAEPFSPKTRTVLLGAETRILSSADYWAQVRQMINSQYALVIGGPVPQTLLNSTLSCVAAWSRANNPDYVIPAYAKVLVGVGTIAVMGYGTYAAGKLMPALDGEKPSTLTKLNKIAGTQGAAMSGTITNDKIRFRNVMKTGGKPPVGRRILLNWKPLRTANLFVFYQKATAAGKVVKIRNERAKKREAFNIERELHRRSLQEQRVSLSAEKNETGGDKKQKKPNSALMNASAARRSGTPNNRGHRRNPRYQASKKPAASKHLTNAENGSDQSGLVSMQGVVSGAGSTDQPPTDRENLKRLQKDSVTSSSVNLANNAADATTIHINKNVQAIYTYLKAIEELDGLLPGREKQTQNGSGTDFETAFKRRKKSNPESLLNFTNTRLVRAAENFTNKLNEVCTQPDLVSRANAIKTVLDAEILEQTGKIVVHAVVEQEFVPTQNSQTPVVEYQPVLGASISYRRQQPIGTNECLWYALRHAIFAYACHTGAIEEKELHRLQAEFDSGVLKKAWVESLQKKGINQTENGVDIDHVPYYLKHLSAADIDNNAQGLLAALPKEFYEINIEANNTQDLCAQLETLAPALNAQRACAIVYLGPTPTEELVKEPRKDMGHYVTLVWHRAADGTPEVHLLDSRKTGPEKKDVAAYLKDQITSRGMSRLTMLIPQDKDENERTLEDMDPLGAYALEAEVTSDEKANSFITLLKRVCPETEKNPQTAVLQYIRENKLPSNAIGESEWKNFLLGRKDDAKGSEGVTFMQEPGQTGQTPFERLGEWLTTNSMTSAVMQTTTKPYFYLIEKVENEYMVTEPGEESQWPYSCLLRSNDNSPHKLAGTTEVHVLSIGGSNTYAGFAKYIGKVEVEEVSETYLIPLEPVKAYIPSNRADKFFDKNKIAVMSESEAGVSGPLSMPPPSYPAINNTDSKGDQNDGQRRESVHHIGTTEVHVLSSVDGSDPNAEFARYSSDAADETKVQETALSTSTSVSSLDGGMKVEDLEEDNNGTAVTTEPEEGISRSFSMPPHYETFQNTDSKSDQKDGQHTNSADNISLMSTGSDDRVNVPADGASSIAQGIPKEKSLWKSFTTSFAKKVLRVRETSRSRDTPTVNGLPTETRSRKKFWSFLKRDRKSTK